MVGFMISSVVYLSYDHNKREFSEVPNQKKFEKILNGTVDEISNTLEGLGIDGLMLFRRDQNVWQLIFRKDMGIVAQRTARRQADTISRSGFLLSSGERVGTRSSLEQLTNDNIGDLSKSVQQKYIASDLSGYKGDSRQN